MIDTSSSQQGGDEKHCIPPAKMLGDATLTPVSNECPYIVRQKPISASNQYRLLVAQSDNHSVKSANSAHIDDDYIVVVIIIIIISSLMERKG